MAVTEVKKPKESKFEVHIEIKFNDISTSEITSLYVMRCPFVKNSSFARLDFSISNFKFAQIEKEISYGRYPDLKLEVWSIDPSSHKKNKEYKRLDKIIEKVYIIKKIKTDESRTPNNPTIQTELLLINPILDELSMGIGFNEILNNIKGLDAIIKYEEYLTGRFGSVFEFIKIGENESKTKNPHRYEHIQIMEKNDLCVPDFLLYDKKAINSLSYYVFDDFRIDKDKKGDICGMLINLYNLNVFKQIDIFESRDIGSAKLIEVTPFDDPNSCFSKNNARISCRDPKTTITREPKQPEVKSKNFNLKSIMGKFAGRESNTVEIQDSLKNKVAISILNIVTPDTSEVALKRFETVKKQIKENINAIHEYEVTNCFPDIFQFDRIYNLEPNAKSSYNQVPISIVNIFKKDSGSEIKMNHNVRMLTLRFEDPLDK